MALTPEKILIRTGETSQLTSEIASPQYSIRPDAYQKRDAIFLRSAAFDKNANQSLRVAYDSNLAMDSGGWISLFINPNWKENHSSNYVFTINGTIWMWTQAVGKIRSVMNGYTGSLARHPFSSLTPSESEGWTHLVWNYGAFGRRTWVNRKLVYSSTSPITYALGTGEIVLGRSLTSTSSSAGLHGEMSCASIGGDVDLSQAQVDLLNNEGCGIRCENLTAQQKTDLELKAYWHLDEASGTRFDSHGSYDLTDTNNVASGGALVPIPTIGKGSATVDATGLVSAGAKAGNGTIQARSSNLWDYAASAFGTESNGDKTYPSTANVNSYVRTRGCLSQRGDKVTVIFHQPLGYNNVTSVRLYPTVTGGGTIQISGAKYQELSTPTGSHNYSFSEGSPIVLYGDEIIWKWNNTDELEYYVNGKLIHTSLATDVDLVAGVNWRVIMYGGRGAGDIIHYPIFEGLGVGALGLEQETTSLCATETADDLINEVTLVDVDGTYQQEADDAAISTVINKGTGQDGIATRDATKRVGDAIELSNSAISFGDIYKNLGNSTWFLVAKANHALNKTLWSEHSTEGYYPYTSQSKIYEDVGTSARVSFLHTPEILTAKHLYAIRAGVDFWEAQVNGSTLHTLTDNIPEYVRDDFYLGSAKLAGATNAWEGYVFKWLVFDRKLNDAEMEQMVTVLTPPPPPPPPPAPVVAFTIPAEVEVGQTFTVANSTTGTVDSYSIDKGDGSAATTAIGASFSYAAPGTYQFEVIGVNEGGSNTAAQTITVVEQKPIITGFTVNKTALVMGESLTIDSIQASGGDIDTYQWKVNNVLRDTSGATPALTKWLKKGANTIGLICSNTGGDSALVTKNIAHSGKTVIVAGTANPLEHIEALPSGVKAVVRIKAKDPTGNVSDPTPDQEKTVI